MNKRKKWVVNGLLIIAVATFVFFDLRKSTRASVAEGTFRLESEFDAVSAPTTKVAVVPSDYSGLASPVSRTVDPSYTQVEAMVRKAIELQGGLDWVVDTGDLVMIKPNLVGGDSPSGQGENTDVRVVKALIKIIHEYTGGDVEILVAEGTARTNDNPTADNSVWDNSGYKDLVTDPYLGGINFSLLNLNQTLDDVLEVDLGDKGTSAPHEGKFKVHKKEREADVFITVPVLKIHHTGITCALKNQIGTGPGCVYGYNKEMSAGKPYALAHDIDQRRWTTETIVDLCQIADIDFVVVDAIMCLELQKSYSGNNQVRMNTIVAGSDPVAVDHVCTRLMDLNPDDIAHITLAEKVGLGTNNTDKIDVVGAAINEVKKTFMKNGSANGIFGQSCRTWLLSQKFTGGISTEYIAGEDTLEPVAGVNGWSQPTYFFDDRIDLLSYYGGPINTTSYAFTYFTAPETQPAELQVGSDESMVVYINGAQAYSYTGLRSYPEDNQTLNNDTATINIMQGRNTLMVKTYHNYGDYSFVLNICENNATGNRVDGLKFHTTPYLVNTLEVVKGGHTIIRIYPNPCTDRARIAIDLDKTSSVSVNIYDIQGKLVKTVATGIYQPGKHELVWDLTGDKGHKLPAGVYICNAYINNRTFSQAIIVR